MSWAVCTDVLYLALTAYITIAVGQHLHRRGRVFIVACFAGRVELADALNHLLLICYYLLNLGMAAMLIKDEHAPQTGLEMFERLSGKIGLVLLVLGTLHAGNMFFLRISWGKFHTRTASDVVDPVGG